MSAACERAGSNALNNTFHLQRAHRFANVVECYVMGDVGNADAWRYDETDSSVFEFLVHLYRFENLFARELRRQPRRQSESFQQTNDRIALLRPQSSFCNGDNARGNDSKADCFSVQE